MLQLTHVYSVPTNEVVALSIPKSLTEGQQSSVSLMIQSLLHIDRSDQELMTPTGTVVDINTDLSHYCRNQVATVFLLI